jgi:hypothetical protein
VAGLTILFGILDIFQHTHQRHVFLLAAAAATVRVEK